LFPRSPPGEDTYIDGVTYDDFVKAGGGGLKIHDGWYEFAEPRRRPGTSREAAAKAGKRPWTDG
jgi:hypothetical protein